jgi:hypothetical protein
MDSQILVKYRIWNPVDQKAFTTESRIEALAYYEKGWMVVEKHKIIVRASIHNVTETIVSMGWNNNPEFERE